MNKVVINVILDNSLQPRFVLSLKLFSPSIKRDGAASSICYYETANFISPFSVNS